MRQLNAGRSVNSPDLRVSLLGGAAQWEAGEGGAREWDPCTFELQRQLGWTVARATSYFTPVAFLGGETALWSPAGEGKHLDSIFPSLGKNGCQQLAGTHESVRRMSFTSQVCWKVFFFVYTHICSHLHTYSHTHIHTYIHTYIHIYIYEDGYKEICVYVRHSIVSNSLQSSGP